jgi:hypothetical protein
MHRFKELSLGGCKQEKVPFKHCLQNVWLVKPIGGNQGRGIKLFDKARDILDYIYR